MRIRDQINCKEFNTTIQVRDANGNVKKLWNDNTIGKLTGLRIPFVTGAYRNQLNTHNLITTLGVAAVSALIGNISSPVNFQFLALGTSATAATVSDTTLGAEITTGGLARTTATITHATITTTNDSASFQHTFTATSSFAVTEEGILSAASAGVLLAHQVFSAINLNSGDSITITHVVTA